MSNHHHHHHSTAPHNGNASDDGHASHFPELGFFLKLLILFFIIKSTVRLPPAGGIVVLFTYHRPSSDSLPVRESRFFFICHCYPNVLVETNKILSPKIFDHFLVTFPCQKKSLWGSDDVWGGDSIFYTVKSP